MELTFICNAGLALTYDGKTLIVDAPNMDLPPFRYMKDEAWRDLCERYDICGFFYTHDHPDHLDKKRMMEYIEQHPNVAYHVPTTICNGRTRMGPFEIEYHSIPHAPIPEAPPHVVSLIRAGDKVVYVAADAALETEAHKKFLDGRCADVAVWTPMYLSRADTRSLMAETARRNFIYHMPERPDSCGIWRKCEKNFERYGQELATVSVVEDHPKTVDI